MKKSNDILLIFLLISVFGLGQTGTEGYYKDIFMDGGVNLYSKTSLPAADGLGLSVEYIATGDETIQNERLAGNPNDVNGILLYPDGAPRFRLLHTNGGSASSHGTSLGEEGRENIRNMYYSGGSYTGVCAGAFISSVHYQNSGTNESYYHIWPGRTTGTGIVDIYTNHFIEPDSPLLQYYSFGNDMRIAHIYHNGGCYANETDDFPPNTEILLRFDKPGPGQMNHKASCWAYKENDDSGRLVVFGSHPEDATSGEGFSLMKAMLEYALDGRGDIRVKGTLENGVARVMDKSTEENIPEYTKIGDKQYHHFLLQIPDDAIQLKINMDTQQGFHFNIYVNKNDFAFRSNALYSDTTFGSQKTLIAEPVSAGLYYISVECETTVDAIPYSWGFEYVNNTEVLNGIEYTIMAEYTTGISVDAHAFLEGPFGDGYMASTLNSEGLLPLSQPYNEEPWNYNGTENVHAIPNDNVVDWILAELRETTGDVLSATPATIVGQQAGFILKDGSIVATDGETPLRFNHSASNNLFLVLYHRNHAGVISANALQPDGDTYFYDFTTSANSTYGGTNALKQLTPDFWGLASGDSNCDGAINNLDKNESWQQQYGFVNGYFEGDMNMDGKVDEADLNGSWSINAGRCAHIIK